MTGECERCREAVRACGGVAALERMRACADSATARERAAAALRNLAHV